MQRFTTILLARYDFRKRVSNVLNVDISRLTILSGALSTDRTEGCQQVTFMVSGKELCHMTTCIVLADSVCLCKQA